MFIFEGHWPALCCPPLWWMVVVSYYCQLSHEAQTFVKGQRGKYENCAHLSSPLPTKCCETSIKMYTLHLKIICRTFTAQTQSGQTQVVSHFPLKSDSLNTDRQNTCSLKVFYFSLMGRILVKFFCTSLCNSSCCLHNCLQSPLAF